MKNQLIPTLLLILLSLTLAACSAQIPTPATPEPAEAATQSSPSPGSVTPVSCAEFGLTAQPDFDCSYVTVPQFHDQPDGDTLQLATLVVKATGDNPAPDPLFLENGGPGSPTISLIASYITAAPAIASLAEDRDLVLVDQRGTQHSNPFLACLPEDSADDIEDVKTTYHNCKTRLEEAGVDFNAYNRGSDIT